MTDLRLRSQISEEELAEKVGKIVTDDDYNVLLTRNARVRKPDGTLLCIYLKGGLPEDEVATATETLRAIRTKSWNRGMASGMPRSMKHAGKRASSPKAVPSALVGALDPVGRDTYCRLTAWTGRETDAYKQLWPLLQAMGKRFEENVPERHANQMRMVEKTHPDWVIPGTPFTTVTVNNTYPTGVHTDKGDLDEGFSCLGTLRHGVYTGGVLVFPKFRIAVDMQHRDMILMDAHEFHGNTMIEPQSDDAERISVVAYYRTKMVVCESHGDEERKRFITKEQRNAALIGE